VRVLDVNPRESTGGNYAGYMINDSTAHSMGALQELGHGAGHDYAKGSPHILHHSIRAHVTRVIQGVVAGILDHKGQCRVLELGAGHGTFTDHVVAVGAEVEVTEMSAPSVEVLRHRFRHNKRVNVTYDADGNGALAGEPVDVVLCISMLHHIPDYLAAVRRLVRRIAVGGAFVSFQDPLWYPRRSAGSLTVERGAYLLWRLGQGQLRRGVASVLRRRRGAYDETNPADMVEYHVVRKGVDELALRTLLEPTFRAVEVRRYWSTNLASLQFVGERLCPPTTFGVLARNRH
jgi:phospholipid N-methyltransferase